MALIGSGENVPLTAQTDANARHLRIDRRDAHEEAPCSQLAKRTKASCYVTLVSGKTLQ